MPILPEMLRQLRRWCSPASAPLTESRASTSAVRACSLQDTGTLLACEITEQTLQVG